MFRSLLLSVIALKISAKAKKNGICKRCGFVFLTGHAGFIRGRMLLFFYLRSPLTYGLTKKKINKRF